MGDGEPQALPAPQFTALGRRGRGSVQMFRDSLPRGEGSELSQSPRSQLPSDGGDWA